MHTEASAQGGIWEAILEFQADLPVLTKNKAGHQSKYADLVQVNEVILPRLNKLGITYTALPTMTDDDKFRLRYELRHIPSGEVIVGLYPLKMSENPQQMGSAITYARRYALLAALDIAAEDEDDDGQSASGQRTAQRAAPRGRQGAQAKPAAQDDRPTAQRAQRRAEGPPLPGEDAPRDAITEKQMKMLHALFGKVEMATREERLQFVNEILAGQEEPREITSSAMLTKAEATAVIDKLKSWADQIEPDGDAS